MKKRGLIEARTYRLWPLDLRFNNCSVGLRISRDNQVPKAGDLYLLKEMMVSGLPKFIYCFGITNASWTFKGRSDCQFTFVKSGKYMDKHELEVVDLEGKQDRERSRTSQFKVRGVYHSPAEKDLPKQGSKRPQGGVYQNYLVDMLTTRFAPISGFQPYSFCLRPNARFAFIFLATEEHNKSGDLG